MSKKLSLIIFIFVSCFFFSCDTTNKYEIKLVKKIFSPEEAISVKYTANSEWEATAWIGIVPSSVPHGKEEINDNFDIAYIYLNKSASGTFVIPAPAEKGEYDLRMHNSDSPDIGTEITYVSFVVK